MDTIKDKCAIVGIGETEYSMHSGRSSLTLALEAIKKAIEDAGLNIKEIDGIVRWHCDTSANDCMIATNLGIPNLRYSAEVTQYGGGAPGAIANAALAVAGGMANNVVCFRALNRVSDLRGGAYASPSAEFQNYRDYEYPFGFTRPIEALALMTRRHMYEYGTTSEQLGAIAIAARKHGSLNPRAMIRTPITMEEYLNSPMVADPLRLFDCCLATDGACAVVVTSAERAKGLRNSPAHIMAAVQAFGPLPDSRGVEQV